ncbi:hypothetical protein LILAB_33520 [Corallococcus macrosporus]|uniref:Uncharacterized protein n=1 Tax=Myxococcus fulvus (strain ATCC BAA-855 / HW-1) TaxID=483219 RepID=F8CEZ7_MYXFH|nr:hypothetical protein LILAB_33520 [Corallococcus macrosporus]
MITSMSGFSFSFSRRAAPSFSARSRSLMRAEVLPPLPLLHTIRDLTR